MTTPEGTARPPQCPAGVSSPATTTGRQLFISYRLMTHHDAAQLRAFFQHLSPLARYRRFLTPMRDVPDYLLAQLARVDGIDHVAFLAETIEDGRRLMIGEARYVASQARDQACDFALAVADKWQGTGIGRALLARLLRHAADAGHQAFAGETLPDNVAMIGLARQYEFTVSRCRRDPRIKKLTRCTT